MIFNHKLYVFKKSKYLNVSLYNHAELFVSRSLIYLGNGYDHSALFIINIINYLKFWGLWVSRTIHTPTPLPPIFPLLDPCMKECCGQYYNNNFFVLINSVPFLIVCFSCMIWIFLDMNPHIYQLAFILTTKYAIVTLDSNKNPCLHAIK